MFSGKHYKFWVKGSQGTRETPDFLHISKNGDHFTIVKEGIYFIYAQVL